jgi:hypothetical protein
MVAHIQPTGDAVAVDADLNPSAACEEAATVRWRWFGSAWADASGPRLAGMRGEEHPDMNDPLAGIEAKLTRARKHFDELHAETASFLESQPWTIVQEFDENTGEHVGRYRILRQPPLEIGVIAGEVLGQCRSALDHLVVAMTQIRDPAQKPVTFPIFANMSKDVHGNFGWADAKDGRRLFERILSKHQFTLVEMAQPCKHRRGPGPRIDWLSRLQQFTNRDKHHVVNPTFLNIGALGRRRSALDWPNVERIRFPWMHDPRGLRELANGDWIDAPIIELAIEWVSGFVADVRAVTPELQR